MNQQSSNSGFHQEGDVMVKRPKRNDKSAKKFDGGEYVDFEEVKD